jgi:Tryptophan halogenase.
MKDRTLRGNRTNGFWLMVAAGLNNVKDDRANRIKDIVIVGGGTAGWMTAAALAQVLRHAGIKITLVESEAISTVGVGEATIPAIRQFNSVLALNEDEFIRQTGGTFKLGIQFVDWYKKNHSYYHPFGNIGTRIERIAFQHYWQRLFNAGKTYPLENFSLNIQACENNKFIRPIKMSNSPLAEITYAFHFDAGLYARYLRGYAEKNGAVRIEGLIDGVNLRAVDGFIESVHLATGETVAGDLFIDCSGFRGLLIGQWLGTAYEDWSNFLPCDSAVAVASSRLDPLPPYTRATAKEAGWQWRIPLQHRTGNGYVYSSKYVSDERALETLLSGIEEPLLGEPRVLRFKAGRREKMWNKNCVAIGLSSGFLEPLESTSIHLVQGAISKLLDLFPTAECHPTIVDKFNEQLAYEYETIRDFLILHYNATLRDDSGFWNYCRHMEIPKALSDKINLYRYSGRVYRDNYESFGGLSWLAVMRGQGILTKAYNPVADHLPMEKLITQMEGIKSVIDSSCRSMPLHEEYIGRNCRADWLL